METPANIPMMPRVHGAPIPVAVSKAAVRWLIALDAPQATQQTREQWRAWLEADSAHARAWAHVQEMGVCLRQVNPAIAHSTLVQPDAAMSAGRRRALRMLAGGAVSAAGVWALQGSTGWQAWRADYRTAIGERRRIALADGGEVVLNTDSAVNIRFDEQRRLLHMVRGEMLVTTGQDRGASSAMRPFLVETAQGRLRALGTRFTVRQREDECLLSVLHGAVEVQPAEAQAESFVVDAGRQARFDRWQLLDSMQADPAAGAWSNGMLVVHRMPLGEFVAELARYRSGYLGCDAAVAELAVSGIFPVDDTERVLDMLRKTLPVSVRSRTRYWVTVQAAT
ncbi:FecR domain-containing protein [Bordetella genomosp. 13]|uniref:FecR domain-containing protein n=1 Tax=Bordetella genomosp. 13 TaxID=463040 RepID=UPI00119E0505|nr:FecR domain-containing protein [Bordetella genomosp. 13]